MPAVGRYNKSLIFGARHGYDVSRWIFDTSRETLRVDEGALYTALHRMENRGWLESEWGMSDNNRRATFYQITPKGRAARAQYGGLEYATPKRCSSSFAPPESSGSPPCRSTESAERSSAQGVRARRTT